MCSLTPNAGSNSMRQVGWLTGDLTRRFLSCPGARETWRYLRRGVLLRDTVHPTTMKAMRIVCSEPGTERGSAAGSAPSNPAAPGTHIPWDGTEGDLERFAAPVSLESETAALELIMKFCALEADAWGDAGVAAALAEDPRAPDSEIDLDGLELDPDRRLMLSVFRQEKLCLLRDVISRLTHMVKVSGLLNRPIKMPPIQAPPVLGPPVSRNLLR